MRLQIPVASFTAGGQLPFFLSDGLRPFRRIVTNGTAQKEGERTREAEGLEVTDGRTDRRTDRQTETDDANRDQPKDSGRGPAY